MSRTTSVATLTPRQRLARGLTYSAVGPLDVTRGAVGLGVQSAGSSAAWLRDRYRSGAVRRDLEAAREALVAELTAAQEAIAALPGALPASVRTSRKVRRRPRPVVLAAAGVAVVAVGAVTFSIVRRSTQPDPSPLPPSVDVTPKP